MFFIQRPSSRNAPHFVNGEASRCAELSWCWELRQLGRSTHRRLLQMVGEHRRVLGSTGEHRGAILALSTCGFYTEVFFSGTRQATPK